MTRTDAIKAAFAMLEDPDDKDEEVDRVGYVVGYTAPHGWRVVSPGDEGAKHELTHWFYVTLDGPDDPETQTLGSLVSEHGANAFTLADRGNGSGVGERGQFSDYDDEAMALYGDIELHPLEYPEMNENGTLCFYASDWQDGIDRDVQPYQSPNDYQFRILF
jgi:hypothetical protein